MPRSSSMGIRHLLQHWSRLPLLKKPDIDSEVDASRKEYAAEDYSQYMRMAIDLGKYSKAEDDKPRPKVGAVVIKGGTLLGCAYRGEQAPGDHAEYTLLGRRLPEANLDGATLFTTLEPCTSRKRHKPCCDRIIERGVTNVVIGMLDPNPRIYSLGASKLRQRGIKVTYFPEPLRKEIETDNREFISQFAANPQTEGSADFDYGDNDGFFTIGNGKYIFKTRWSKASDVSIHVYRDGTNLEGLAIALDAHAVSDISSASVYDMSSRVRTIDEGQFIVLKNLEGYFAAIHVVDVKDRDRHDNQDELFFRYWILTDKSQDFSSKSES